MRRNQLRDVFRGHVRHVAVENHHRAGITLKGCLRALHRVGRAHHAVLNVGRDRLPREALGKPTLHQRSSVAHHHSNLFCTQRKRMRNRVGHHRKAAHLVHHLRKR